MAKCDICKDKVETTFLDKIIGTHIKVNKKRKLVCNGCQKKFSIKELKEKLK